jgi:hypothetical protein
MIGVFAMHPGLVNDCPKGRKTTPKNGPHPLSRCRDRSYIGNVGRQTGPAAHPLMQVMEGAGKTQ